VVAEEVVIRARQEDNRAWRDWEGLFNPQRPPLEGPAAGEAARVYRELRKGREDAKDQPGAADFYYGEMEMRRRSARRLSVEKFILWLYWLVSGYGLRGSRAIASLFALIAVTSVLMHRFGYVKAHTWTESLLQMADSATKLLGVNAATGLTGWGVVLQITVRLLGPTLLALAILAVRERTKR
jgi:hypothetical protein